MHSFTVKPIYVTVTLAKWPCDRYIQGDCCTQVSFKLPWKSINNLAILGANNHSIYILLTITSHSNTIKATERTHKTCVVFFQGGAVKDYWKLMNNVFKRKIASFTFIDNNFKRERHNYAKKMPIKCPWCTLREVQFT